MRYPTLSRERLVELAPSRLATGTCDIEAAFTWSGTGDDVDLLACEVLETALAAQLASFEASPQRTDKDMFEGIAAGQLHAALSELPLLVLDDPGFWRYLALRYFWDLVVWREATTFGAEYAKYRKYVDGVSVSECVLTRMYLRAQIALDDGDYGLAAAIPRGTDFWRSHVLRVGTSAIPLLARAFAEEQVTNRMGTDELRDFARRLNRVRMNVVVAVYDEGEAELLLDELRETIESTAGAGSPLDIGD